MRVQAREPVDVFLLQSRLGRLFKVAFIHREAGVITT